MSKNTSYSDGNSWTGINIFIKIGTFLVILESVWMLLPFAGFLYGTILPIELLSRSPYTTRLVHFIFPTHTLFPLGLLLILIGLLGDSGFLFPKCPIRKNFTINL